MYIQSLHQARLTARGPLCQYSFSFYKNSRVTSFNYSRGLRSQHEIDKHSPFDSRRENVPSDSAYHLRQTQHRYIHLTSHSSETAMATSSVVKKRNASHNQQQETLTEATNKSSLGIAVVPALKFVMKLYDFATLPIYAVLQKPWNTLARHNAKKSNLINKDRNIYGTVIPKSIISEDLEMHGVDTLEKAFSLAVAKHGDRACSGNRKIISEHKVKDENGKLVTKYKLGDYQWKTFDAMDLDAHNFSLGLAALNIKSKEQIAIFADTREEWLLSVMAAFKRNISVVTIFTILGDEGVLHALNETEVACVITSEGLMPRCMQILKSAPKVKQVIFMPNNTVESGSSSHSYDKDMPSNVNLSSFQEIMSLGEKCAHLNDRTLKPKPEDTAILMYTSGSTGVPKGVILSHYNVITSLKILADSLIFSVGDSIEEDAYIAYLPMAHIMELIGETFCLLKGIKIGFSSPTTLVDSSLGIHPGTKGDMYVLKPTVFPAAPLVLERICKGIKSKIDDMGLRNLFDYLYDYKKHWLERGYKTSLLDKLFFKRIGSLTGGRVRLITCGGAPLASHSHEFVKNVLCTSVCLSYGMTETSGLAAFTQSHDLRSGRVGGPIGGSAKLRIVNWDEGNYKVTDKPYPRGEVYIGGENVSLQGYFKRPDTGDFFIEDGVRWVKTGDIVEVQDDGGFNIIDRKKDLVKVSTGEYVSLGKVESILKTNTLVENICVVADPFQPYIVAILVPIQPKIEKLAETFGLKGTSFEELCKDSEIVQAVLEDVQKHGVFHKLEKYEIPRKIFLSNEPWLPQSGLVTAALKNQRNNLARHFQSQIKGMYSS